MSMVVRNAGELSADQFDPNPLLLSTATLMQHNKAQCRVRTLLQIVDC